SASAAGRARAIEAWRGGSKASEEGWADAGVATRSEKEAARTHDKADGFEEGMLVRHDQYGTGRVMAVAGYGAQRKIKVRFRTAGERTFLAEKAKLAIIKNP